MTSYTRVFVGDYGDYVIPEDVCARARELTPESRLKDRRTKGAKYLELWGRSMEARQDTIDAIKKHCQLI